MCCSAFCLAFAFGKFARISSSCPVGTENRVRPRTCCTACPTRDHDAVVPEQKTCRYSVVVRVADWLIMSKEIPSMQGVCGSSMHV